MGCGSAKSVALVLLDDRRLVSRIVVGMLAMGSISVPALRHGG
jgi:hypothetical protein